MHIDESLRKEKEMDKINEEIYECWNCIYWQEHVPEAESDGYCTKYREETYADDNRSNIELK